MAKLKIVRELDYFSAKAKNVYMSTPPQQKKTEKKQLGN